MWGKTSDQDIYASWQVVYVRKLLENVLIAMLFVCCISFRPFFDSWLLLVRLRLNFNKWPGGHVWKVLPQEQPILQHGPAAISGIAADTGTKSICYLTLQIPKQRCGQPSDCFQDGLSDSDTVVFI
jgi:hypothetical protein